MESMTIKNSRPAGPEKIASSHQPTKYDLHKTDVPETRVSIVKTLRGCKDPLPQKLEESKSKGIQKKAIAPRIDFLRANKKAVKSSRSKLEQSVRLTSATSSKLFD